MTDYATAESSQAGSEPLEGYELVGSATTWRFASGMAEVTIDGNVYTPLAGLIRSEVAIGGTSDSPVLVVTLPSSAQVIAHYGFATPPRSLRLTVYRYQVPANDFIVVWQGEVIGMASKGPMTDLHVPSTLDARLGASIPSLTVRKTCQHFLYDDRCRVARASFDHATTVASVNATDPRIVTIAGAGGHPDQYFRAGEIVRDSDDERKSIVAQLGATLWLSSPFGTLTAADAVTMYAGCDHKPATCRDTFVNIKNFSGFALLPRRNPIARAIVLGDTAAAVQP